MSDNNKTPSDNLDIRERITQSPISDSDKKDMLAVVDGERLANLYKIAFG